MNIVKAPLRVSLFGGGCDLPEYADEYGATILSFALDAAIYVTWNRRPTGGCRLTYSEVEELDTLRNARHDLVRAAAATYGLPEPCTLSIVSDIPKGTGLGSSSALAVALCALADAARQSGEDLATTAYHLERTVANVGWQDHLPATFGGVHVYRYAPDTARVTMYPVPEFLHWVIENYGLLLYTNRSRPAAQILRTWAEQVDTLHQIRYVAEGVADDLDTLGMIDLVEALRETWELKATIPGVVDDELRAQYAAALKAGALAGKLLGAGAGGCWFFLVPPELRRRVIDRLGMTEIPFQISPAGVSYGTL
jgi:D-glycero-alpha-D-manno-heptose-7-phosphate kinase